METAWLVLTVVAWVPTTLYLLDYGRRSWWKSSVGRYMFLKACVIWSLLTMIMVSRFLGPLGAIIWVPLLALLGAAQWALYLIYRRIQYGKDKINETTN